MASYKVSRKTATIVIVVVVLAVAGFGAWYILDSHFTKVSDKEAIEHGKKEADAMEQFYRERLPKKNVPPKNSSVSATTTQ